MWLSYSAVILKHLETTLTTRLALALQAFEASQQHSTDLQAIARVVVDTIGEHVKEVSPTLKVALGLSEQKWNTGRALLGLDYDSIDNR